MAAQQPLPNSAFIKVEIDETSNWNNATSYTDVSSDVRIADGLSWERGRDDEFQVTAPGDSTFTLNDKTRAYDPVSNTDIVPARPCRITCYYPTTGTSFQQMDAMVEDWIPSWTPDGDAVTKVNAVERYAALAFYNVAQVIMPSQTNATVRLGQLADLAGWPSGSRSFGATSYNVSQQTYVNTDVLGAMQGVAASQGQVLYESRSGTLTTRGLFASTASSIGTFGDQAGELKYSAIELGVGGGYLYTQVKVTAAAATNVGTQNNQPITVTKNVGSPYTIAKYGTRTWSIDVAAMSLTDAQSLATALASSLASNPVTRIKSITIRPLADPANIFPVILGADLGNTVTVKLTPPGGGSRITQALKIRSIRHEVSDKDWVCTFGVSP